MGAALAEADTEIFIDGPMYTGILAHIHDQGAPETYFEIGSLHGDTLRLARRRALAVDPVFQLAADFPADPDRITLREMTSDDYFAGHDLEVDLGAKVDLAFLDGMHEFPFLLRDFISTEKACRPNSLIVLHDCVPRDYHMTRMHRDVAVARPSNYPGYWTGDVWKMIPVLRQYRPDLEIHCLDAVPTGLAICTRLDPDNRVLEDNYVRIMQDWEAMVLDDFGMRRLFEIARIEPVANWRRTASLFRAPSLAGRLKRALASLAAA